MGSLEQGAMTAVEVCMGVKAKEHVLIVTDRAQLKVGTALKSSAERITGEENVKLFVIEDLCTRPLKALPEQVDDMISWANVTFWAVQSQPGELPARQRFIRQAQKYARHGHMPNISEELMKEGMCSDYNEVYALTHKVYDLVSTADRIIVTNRLGVNLEVEFEKSWKWIPCDGRYHERGKWGNLPEGEIFTAPKRVNGLLVTNQLGDWFSEKYGNFRESISFEIDDSMIVEGTIKCDNGKLKQELIQYISADPNGARASEFALPTNPYLIAMPTIGNLLQDEKARAHIAFGDPYRNETGAPWDSTTHVDMLLEGCDVTVDGKNKAIMRSGKYII